MDITFTAAWNVYNNANLTENLQIKDIKAKFMVLAENR